jgi:transposase
MSRKRGQAYSQDLRERVMRAVDGGLGVYAAAPLFGVSVSYIYKALGRRRSTGETTVRAQRGHQAPALAAYHTAIMDRVASHPDETIDELRAWLLNSHGVSASTGGMWNTLDRLGLTFKKRRSTPASRSGPTSPKRGRPGAPASSS